MMRMISQRVRGAVVHTKMLLQARNAIGRYGCAGVEAESWRENDFCMRTSSGRNNSTYCRNSAPTMERSSHNNAHTHVLLALAAGSFCVAAATSAAMSSDGTPEEERCKKSILDTEFPTSVSMITRMFECIIGKLALEAHSESLVFSKIEKKDCSDVSPNQKSNSGTSSNGVVDDDIDSSNLPTFTRQQVSLNNGGLINPQDKNDRSRRPIWVTYGKYVYDITDFVANHPGGQEKILMAAGMAH